MRKPLPANAPLRDTHPDKEHFRKLIEQETNRDKIRQLKEEEAAHNHPNRKEDEHK
jgi:hypothetical protein